MNKCKKCDHIHHAKICGKVFMWDSQTPGSCDCVDMSLFKISEDLYL